MFFEETFLPSYLIRHQHPISSLPEKKNHPKKQAKKIKATMGRRENALAD